MAPAGPPVDETRSGALARVSDGVVATDGGLNCTYVDSRAGSILGVDESAAVGRSVRDLFGPAAADAAAEAVEQAMDAGERRRFEWHDSERASGFEASVHPGADGATLLLAELPDRPEGGETAERAEAVFRNVRDALFLVDVVDGGAEFRISQVNPAYEAVTGLSNETVRGQPIGEVVGEDDRAAVTEQYRKCVERREPLEYEEELSIVSEEPSWETRIAPVVVDGEVVQLIGSTRNVTEEDRRERQVRQLHAATRDLIDVGTPEEVADLVSASVTDVLDLPVNGVHYYDDAREVLVPATVSDASRDLLGEPPALDGGLAWDAYWAGSPRVYDDVREADAVYDPETPMRSEMYLPLGNHGVLIVASTDVAAFDEGDVALAKLLASNAESVLDQLRGEQELRETRNMLEAVVSSSPDAVVTFDGDGTVLLWNHAAEEIFGWSEAETVGEPLPFVPPDEEPKFEEFRDRIDEEGAVRGIETVRTTRGGERIDVSLSLARIATDSELVGYVATFQDISRRKDYERRLERQRDDLELINEVMSHDVRNDLQVALAYADTLVKRADDGALDEEAADCVEKIRSSTRNAVDLTQTARDLAEAMLNTDDARKPVPLRSVLSAQVQELRTHYDGVSVTVEGRIPRTNVLAGDMLASVYRNILKNAVQHNDETVPEIVVTVDETPETVVVRIADNGPGVPADLEDEAFGRYEKGLESGGTGIGLYLVRTLVDQYGGSVWIEDNEPEGAVFAVELERA